MELSQRLNITLPQGTGLDDDTPDTNADELEQLIADVAGVDAEAISPESTPSSLGIDSLTLIEIVVRAEEAFGVRIEEEDAREFRTVGDFSAYLADHA